MKMIPATQRQHSRTFFGILFFFVCLFSGCGPHRHDLKRIPSSDSIRIDGVLDFMEPDSSVAASIFIEIADTPDSQMNGLMGRKALVDTQGMLFVFERVIPRKFWMKNTLVSLDIIFLNRDGCVVHIVESTPPMSDRYLSSGEPVKYVVEVPAGFVKRFKIDTDTCIRWRHLETHETRP